MRWLVLSYSIPRQAHSSPRVALWRRLRRFGAISPTGSVYVLPGRDECLEAFQWLAQEIRAAKGEALVMQVEQFEGIGDAQLAALFNQARAAEYTQLETEITALEKVKDPAQLRDALEKTRRRHAEIARVDYFASPEGARVAQHLARLAERLLSSRSTAPSLPAARTDRKSTRLNSSHHSISYAV